MLALKYTCVSASVLAQLVTEYFRNANTNKSKKLKLHLSMEDVVCFKIQGCHYINEKDEIHFLSLITAS